MRGNKWHLLVLGTGGSTTHKTGKVPVSMKKVRERHVIESDRRGCHRQSVPEKPQRRSPELKSE